jgi:gliding motility-associated-like protein
LSNSTIADPIATLNSAITYSVAVSGACGSDTASSDLVIVTPTGAAGPDTLTCTGTPVPISASGGATYLWSPAGSLDDPTAQSPNATPLDTTVYIVQITTAEGCTLEDTLTVNVIFDLPDPETGDTTVCLGASVPLHAEGGSSYEWQAQPGINSLFTPDPIVSPTADQYYHVLVTNACGSVADSAFVDVQQVIASAWPDTTVCPGETVKLFAAGGIIYSWSPNTALSDPDSSITFASPQTPVTYTVTAANALGCEGTATATVQHFPHTQVNAGQDTGIDYGESTQLFGYGNGSMVWSPVISLTCDSCVAPVASPEHTTTYILELTDANGCKVSDEVTVFVNGTLYVPNTFTPDGDGVNDGFFAFATEIAEFRLLVFNRWGEEIYASTQLGQPWDGTYGGVQSPIDTYVWRIDLKELNGKKRTVFGHVNLVR